MRCLSTRWRTRWRSLRRGAASTATTWSALFPYFFGMVLLHSLSQVEVICEAREDWWNALLAWLRSLGGSQGICDILQRLLDFTNSLIHLVDCNLSYKPDPECSKTSLANQLAWLKEHDVANTDQLSFTSKAALTIVVIFIHLALSALILAFILPFVCNCVGCFNTKVEEVLARTTRTISTRRTRSRRTRRTRSRRRRTTSRRSSRKATPAGRTHSTMKDKLTIFSGAQVSIAIDSKIFNKTPLTGCWQWQP